MIKFSITGEYFSSSSHKKHQKKRSWVMSCCVGLSQPSLLNSFVTIYIYQFFSQLEIIFIVIIKLARNVDVAISIWIIWRLYKLISKLLWQMKLVYELKIFQTSTFVFLSLLILTELLIIHKPNDATHKIRQLPKTPLKRRENSFVDEIIFINFCNFSRLPVE